MNTLLSAATVALILRIENCSSSSHPSVMVTLMARLSSSSLYSLVAGHTVPDIFTQTGTSLSLLQQ